MNRAVTSCPGPGSRRDFLKAASVALGGVGMQGVIPWKLLAGERDVSPDTSVILVWLPGGPPHMETYDMKPDAPAEFRGEFRPIRTVVPGLDVCEYLPLHARSADKFNLIRSIAHTFSDHGGGHKKFLTARDPRSPVDTVNDYPMVGSMVFKVRGQRPDGVPNYVSGTDGGRDGIDVFAFGSAYLGPATYPFSVAGDPSRPTFQVPNLRMTQPEERMRERLGLLGGLDGANVASDFNGTMRSMNTHRERALGLLTTDAARRAFDLNQEARAVRERYGMHQYGQRCLLARRLVESGASFVTMVLENPMTPDVQHPAGVTYNWDLHAVNGHIFEDSKFRFPFYDRAITALIEDIYARGLDRKVMVIVTGEFGRTPRVSYADGRPGRDHWPQAMSVLVSGAGMRTGQVIGSTNSRGEHPKDRPLTPADLWASMFHHLGIDYANTSFLDHSGRPMPILPFGEPIREMW
jgi:hypothetical protein